MPTPDNKPIDLDALFAARLEERKKDIVTVPITLFGRDWQLWSGSSVTVLLTAADPKTGNMLPYILGLVVPEEQDDFRDALNAVPGLDGELLAALMNEMTETLAGRPTTPSPVSSRTSPTRKSSAR